MAGWTGVCLWRGEIPSRRSTIPRDTEPVQFYAWIFGYSLIAMLFLSAALLFWLHPNFSLSPAIPPGLDDQ